MLIEGGAEVDLKDATGQTALHLAARGHGAVAEVLLDRRAVPDARDNNGRTAADWAARGNHKDVLQLLSSRAGVPGSQRVLQPWVLDAAVPRTSAGAVAAEL